MYQLERKDWVKSQFNNLPERIKRDVAEILLDLQEEPYPVDSLAMRDEYAGYHRIRVDGYRIIYKVDEDTKAVLVWKIAPRTKKTYTKLTP